MVKRLWKYILPVVLAYYLYPLYVIYSPNVDSQYLIGSLLFINPIVVFMSSLFYGFYHRFDFELAVIMGLLFVPSVFIFFNSSAFVYVLIYTMLSVLAQYTGKHAQRKIK